MGVTAPIPVTTARRARSALGNGGPRAIRLLGGLYRGVPSTGRIVQGDSEWRHDEQLTAQPPRGSS
jgi:hypothetical protein